jgi:hypothetical protein
MQSLRNALLVILIAVASILILSVDRTSAATLVEDQSLTAPDTRGTAGHHAAQTRCENHAAACACLPHAGILGVVDDAAEGAWLTTHVPILHDLVESRAPIRLQPTRGPPQLPI